MIPLNVANGPKGKALADVRVRQAIDLAIDRETLVKTVFNGEYIPGNQFISPASPYYNTKVPVPEARRGQGQAAPEGRRPAEPHLHADGAAGARPPGGGADHAGHVAEAGITMNLQTQENVTMLQSGRKGDFEAYFTFWSGRPDPDGNVFTHIDVQGRAERQPLLQRRRGRAAHQGPPGRGPGRAQEALRPGDRDPGRATCPRLHPVAPARLHRLQRQGQGFTPYPDGIIRFRGLKLN